MQPSVFHHAHRVSYGECTVGNHVYFSRFLDLVERARGEFFRHLGCPCQQLQDAGTVFPVVGATISYKAPARYDDLLAIELWITEMHGVRLTFAFRIGDAHGRPLVEGEMRQVCADERGRPRRLPADLAARLRPYFHEAPASLAVKSA